MITANYSYEQIVSIHNVYGQNCTGVIVSSHDVLTTKNCTLGPVNRLLIRSGSNYRNFGGTLHNATNVTIHEKFDQINRVPVNDVALIRVKQAFNNTKPIKLYHHHLKQNQTAQTVKWNIQGVSMNSTVMIVNKTICNHVYQVYLQEGQICTSSNATVHQPCSDNSGVPLMVNGSLAGIFSFSQGCFSDKTVIYTEIARYHDWINRHIIHNATGHKKHNHFNNWGHVMNGHGGMLPNAINQFQNSHGSNSHPHSNNSNSNHNQFPNVLGKLTPHLMKQNQKNGNHKTNSANTFVSGSIVFYIVLSLLITLKN